MNWFLTRRNFLALSLTLVISMRGASPGTPQRIVSLSPDLTEILYGVGAFNCVVGVSNFDTFPPAVSKLPHLGTLDAPDYEKLTALRPDLVVINSAQAPFLEDKLRGLGFHILKASNWSVAEVYTAMAAIGHATGNDDQASKLVADTREGLARVASRAAGRPKLNVVMIVDRTPGTLRDLYTATDGSYLAELVSIAGGHVSAAPSKTGYAKLSTEDLLAADPDVILDFVHGPRGRFSASPVEAWNEMSELKAVRRHRVYSLGEDYITHASQRMIQTAELFARVIHPELK